MSNDLLEMSVSCGTKFGKTYSGSAGGTLRLNYKANIIGRWIAPIHAQSRIGFRYMKKMLPPKPFTNVNKGEPSLTLVHNEAKIEFKSGQKPEDLEGEGTDFNIIDEASKMRPQVYASTKTTTTLTRGPIWEFSTPRGKNHFFHRFMENKSRMEWALKKGKPLTHLAYTAPSSANPYVTKEAIEEAKRSLPERLFRQYFLAEFLEDGGIFTGYAQCIMDMEELNFDGLSHYWLAEGHKGATVVIGADWAKSVDSTVFYAIDADTRACVGFWRFNRIAYPAQVKRLKKFSRQFKETIIIHHDKTGVGDALDDMLAHTNLPYEGLRFTNFNKNEMVTNLMTAMDQVDTYLPNWRQLLNELDNYEVTTTLIGNLTYGAAPGEHDDAVTALLLAYTALLQYGNRDMVVTYTDQNPKATKEDDDDPRKQKPTDAEEEDEEGGLAQYLNELAEDADDD